MGFLSSLLGAIGFGIGIPIGLLVGFFLFIYSKPREVEVIKDPKLPFFLVTLAHVKFLLRN